MAELRELGQRRVEHLLAVLDGVVANQGDPLGEDPDRGLLELHLDHPPLGPELDDVALDLVGGAEQELGPLEDREDVVEGRRAGHLDGGQPGGDAVEAEPVLLHRREALVGLAEHRRDVLEDVLDAAEVDRDDVAPGGDRDHERVRLLRDALGGPVPRPRLRGVDRRVRHQLDVRPGDLPRLRIEDDRAVHLRHLVDQPRRVVDVELEAAAEQEGDLLRLADDDQSARRGVDDVVDALAEGGAGRDHVERPQEPRILVHQPRIRIVPGCQRHQRDQ